MDILYVSSLCSKTKFNKLFEKSKVKPAQQAQKYHRLMAEGLAQNDGINIKVLSAIPINRSMSGAFYYSEELETENEIEYRYLPFFNMPILRHIGLFTIGFLSVVKWCFKNKHGVIICDVLDISVSSAVVLASKITRTPSAGIVTDVPIFLAGMTKSRFSFTSKLMVMINTFVMNRFNSYLFLTELMNDLINKKCRPYVVIEGQVDINVANTIYNLDTKHEAKVCLYAGALHEIYGLRMLTDAFIAANIDGAELHIYGNGEFEEELKIICLAHPNIKYFGVVANDIVVAEQLKATLLINPRPTNEEYTKYSFPSKNMEYMVSGTPVLTTCLPGMPEEYKQYVYIIQDETVDGLTSTLKVVLSKTREELHQKGIEAKKFVLDKKTMSYRLENQLK